MPQLFLFRGLPGSGKSTAAEEFVADDGHAVHLEADMYFLDENGDYKFDASKLRDAHEWCQKTTQIMLRAGWNVVVSNTFTTLKEMEFYLNLAKGQEVLVDVIKFTKNYGSIHNVPQETIERMTARWEDYPGEEVDDGFTAHEDDKFIDSFFEDEVRENQ